VGVIRTTLLTIISIERSK